MEKIDYEAIAREEAEASCSGDCSSCSAGCDKSKVTPKHARLIVAITSGKGGTGKSTVTALLANALAAKDQKVAIIDADITGPTQHLLYGLDGYADSDDSKIFPMTTANGVCVMSMGNVYDKPESPILWQGQQLAGGAEFLYTQAKWDDIDIMLVDMPTGIGSIPLNMFTTIPFDCAIIAATPDNLCDATALKTVNLCKMLMIPPIAVVENKTAMTCLKCGEPFALGSNPTKHAEALGLPLGGILPYDLKLSILAESGRITDYVTPELDDLADSLVKMVQAVK